MTAPSASGTPVEPDVDALARASAAELLPEGPPERAEAVARMLSRAGQAYREAHRAYHGVTHLAELLAHLRRARAHATDYTAVVLAGWFHDAVYQPERKDNEEVSARAATEALRENGFPEALGDEVARLILTTKNHLAVTDPNARVLADADCGIWAASPARYREYARGVRQEYAVHPWPAYALGRRRFLSHVLAVQRERGRLFHFLGPDAEAAALRNLQAEHRALQPLRVAARLLRGMDPYGARGESERTLSSDEKT